MASVQFHNRFLSFPSPPPPLKSAFKFRDRNLELIILPSPHYCYVWLIALPSFSLRLEPNFIPTFVGQRLSDLLHAVHFELQAHNLALIEVQ